MNDRVEEIRRQRDCFACRWTNGEHSQYCQVGILLNALAQAERERELADTIAHRAEHRANQAESDRDAARAEVERLKLNDPVFAASLATTLKEECERQHARAEQAEAALARVRAALEPAKEGALIRVGTKNACPSDIAVVSALYEARVALEGRP